MWHPHTDHVKRTPNTVMVTECFIYQQVRVFIQEPADRELLIPLGSTWLGTNCLARRWIKFGLPSGFHVQPSGSAAVSPRRLLLAWCFLLCTYPIRFVNIYPTVCASVLFLGPHKPVPLNGPTSLTLLQPACNYKYTSIWIWLLWVMYLWSENQYW